MKSYSIIIGVLDARHCDVAYETSKKIRHWRWNGLQDRKDVQCVGQESGRIPES